VSPRTTPHPPPMEAALTKARIPFRVRGQRFCERGGVRDALRILRRLPDDIVGSQLLAALDARLRADLGFEADGQGGGAEARERAANLAPCLAIPAEGVAGRPRLR